MFARLFLLTALLVSMLVSPVFAAVSQEAKDFALKNGISIGDADDYLLEKSLDEGTANNPTLTDPHNPADMYLADFETKQMLPADLKCMQAQYQADQMNTQLRKLKSLTPTQRADFLSQWEKASATFGTCAQMTHDALDFASNASDAVMKKVSTSALHLIITDSSGTVQNMWYAQSYLLKAAHTIHTLPDGN